MQNGRSFNSAGDAEISLIVFKEILINALIHRDYFINDSIKIFMFKNRIEIISPGKLPNNLTVDEMNVVMRKSRDPVISSFATDLLEYK